MFQNTKKELRFISEGIWAKVQFRLALLCGSITAFILLAMSLGFLYVSEQGLKANSFSSFENDMNTLMTNLEHQTVITHEWLVKMEAGGKYLIHITDNGTPFLFNERETPERKTLFAQALDAWRNSVNSVYSAELSDIAHTEFAFSPQGKRGERYYACAAIAQRGNGTLEIMILAPLHVLEAQIQRQRMLFFVLDILAVVALFFFAWHFAKRILRPLEENQRKQIQFVAAASHELRTPLAVMLSCASASEKAADDERAQFLESVRSEGMRMSKLIDDLLLLTTAGQLNFSIQTMPVEPDTLTLNSFEAFWPIAAEKKIALSVSLPEAAVPAIPCDKERITQVLAILLHNAVSFTPSGGHVRLSVSCNARQARFCVEDDGPGIPDAEKERVFERFYRAEKSRTEKGHFGLGLCIAAEIVRAHRGKISVKDAPLGGSIFTVVLPY